MNEKKQNRPIHTDVIQRYCPKRGENVIMLRTYGKNAHLQCISYDTCEREKDAFCGGVDKKRSV